jgi:hypothetical protein
MRFASFAMAGFECASHRRGDGRRIDSLARSGHDIAAAHDLALLHGLGVRTVREGLRWHLIEAEPGRFDFASAAAQLAAARALGIEVIWDLCHWGVPDWLDPFSAEFPARLAGFATAAAAFLAGFGGRVAGWVPVNEISFWAESGGQRGAFAPYGLRRGDELKRRLCEAHIATARALREAGHRQPILVCEPLIHIAAPPGSPRREAAARRRREAAWDAVRWILDAAPGTIDVLGLNYYPHNQWVIGPRRALAAHDPRRRGLPELLAEAQARFGLPLLLAETGDEEPAGEGWIRQVSGEAAEALRLGVDLLGVCIYPAADYRGWDDARRCPCGPISTAGEVRTLRPGYAPLMRRLASLRPRCQAADAA